VLATISEREAGFRSLSDQRADTTTPGGKIGAFATGTTSDEEPVCEIHKDDNDDVFILIDGMKIAKRGLPDA
jgi:hypothetical protein